MSSVNDFDLTKLSPANREFAAQLAFRNREASLVPYVMLVWLDALCLGLAILITAHWFKACWRTERRFGRYLTYWIVAMSFASTVVLQVYSLIWFADGFGIYSRFLNPLWVKIIVLLGACVRAPVMSFYLHRAYVPAGKQIWVVLLIGPMILYVAAAPIAQLWLLRALPYAYVMRQVLATASLCSVIADTLITLIIAVQLYRSRTGWSSTNELISRLLFTLAETQTPPLIMALITLILFYTVPNSTAQIFTVFSPKISCLCLLVTLISRVSLAETDRAGVSSLHSKSYHSASASGAGESSRVLHRESGSHN